MKPGRKRSFIRTNQLGYVSFFPPMALCYFIRVRRNLKVVDYSQVDMIKFMFNEIIVQF